MDERHEAVLRQLASRLSLMAISVGHFMSTPPSSVSVRRKAFDRAAGFDAMDAVTPAIT
jgi:hypothetical protein